MKLSLEYPALKQDKTVMQLGLLNILTLINANPLYPALHCLHKDFHRSTLIILVNDMAGQLRREELQDGATGSPPQDVGQVSRESLA